MNYEIATWDKKNIVWTAKQIVKMIDNNTARFDSSYQRTYVWTKLQKSLMIHSMIMQIPTEPIWAARGSVTRVYDFMEGKQRCNAINDYIKGKYSLEDVPPILYRDIDTGEIIDEESVDINGKYFDDLSEDMQDNILSYTFSINYFEDLDEESQEEFFSRINRGKALSAIELSRVKCPSLNEVQQIAKYPLFDFMTDKQRERYTDEDIVVKMIAMLVMDEPCLDTKEIRPFMETLEVTKAIKDRMYKVTKAIKEMHDELETDELPKIAKRLYVKTHMISLVPFVEKHGVQTEFVKKFFGSGRMTMSKKYNDHATNGSGHAQNVAARVEALEEEFKKFK